MIFLSILIIIVAIALPSIKSHLSSNIITRISAIVFIYSGVLSLNALHIHTIGSGIGIYSGLFHVTIVSQTLDAFLLIMAGSILVAWPLITTSFYSQVKSNLQVLLTSGTSPLVKLSSNSTLSLPLNNSNLETSTPKINTIGSYTPRTEYCLIVLFSALGSSLLISSSDLLSMYLSIELQSFGLYILATLYRDYESATASGLKYFLLGALSSCFILLGAGLIYSFTGLTNFESIYSLLSVSHTATLFTANKIISGVSLGLILIFIGFLFKIAAAPLHSWSPDVYDETPTQVTIWLTIIPKIAILVLLLELQSGFSINSIIDLSSSTSLNTENLLMHLNITSNMFDVTYNTSYVLKMLLLISSLFSLVIGTVVGLAQTRIKRLLAYSTISHIGFILLALAINTEQSTDSFIFYIIQYSLTNLNVFLIIIALGFIINNSGIKWYSNSKNVFLFDFDIRYISSFKGLFFSNPILSLSLAICLFSMSGIPPLLGFFSKQFVLLSAVQSGYWFMAFVGILTSVISASYYLRIVVLLFTESENLTDQVNGDDSNSNSVSILTNFHSFLISSLTLSILLFIFKPTLILNSTQLLALSYFNY
jgi:NADH-ubiquinone oxidoreductase chain 2